MYVLMYMYMCGGVDVHVCEDVGMCICEYVRMCIWICVYLCLCVSVNVYVCMSIYSGMGELLSGCEAFAQTRFCLAPLYIY